MYKQCFQGIIIKWLNYILYTCLLTDKVKNLVSMDLSTTTGQLNCTFILSVLYDGLDKDQIDFLNKSILFDFNKSDAFRLCDENLEVTSKKDSDDQNIMTFTIRKVISTQLHGQTFWSPFQIIKFLIRVTLRAPSNVINGKSINYKFNLMDCKDKDVKYSVSEQTLFGIYRIAENRLEAQYMKQIHSLHKEKKQTDKHEIYKDQSQQKITNSLESSKSLRQVDQERKKLKKEKILSFHHAQFTMTTYKRPGPTIITVYFPLILLGIINIGIFFQNTRQVGKVLVNIATLLVSFIALIPTVRDNTPTSNSVVTVTQIIVFIESSTTLLTFIHMIVHRNEDYIQRVNTDGLLLASILITSAVIFFLVLMLILHQYYWEPQYHMKPKKELKKKNIKFERSDWKNQQCDQYFQKFYHKLRFLSSPPKKKK